MVQVSDNISFDGEMPFPENNVVIYREIYTIEQWLRRIIYAAMVAKHGKIWLDIIPHELGNNLKSRLTNLQDRVYLDCENSDNIIWLLTLGELHQLFTLESIWPVVNILTGYNPNFISSKINELREIRNVIGHNRAVTHRTLTIWRGLSMSLRHGIENFKSKLLYNEENVIHLGVSKDVSEDSVAKNFHLKIRNNDWHKFQPVFSESEYFYSLTHLPVEPFGRFVRVSSILDAYLSLKHVILAILINKSGDEFTISWPKTASVERHHSVIDKFLESAREVWTTTDYIKQDPKFVCDPMIWFYENRKPIEE